MKTSLWVWRVGVFQASECLDDLLLLLAIFYKLIKVFCCSSKCGLMRLACGNERVSYCVCVSLLMGKCVCVFV